MRKFFEIVGDAVGCAALFFTGYMLIVLAGIMGG